MKNVFIISCLLFLSYTLIAQDWQLLNRDYHYHFIPSPPRHNPIIIDTLSPITIRVDSLDGFSSFMNKAATLVPGELDPSYKNRIQFLQEKFTEQPDGSVWFHNPHTFVIFPPSTPIPWTFDTLANVQVIQEEIGPSETYGEEDSIRTLVLSSGDSLVLSKKFGILRFPTRYSLREEFHSPRGDSYRYFQQVGISGPDKGVFFPSLEEIFSFSIGDSFEYHYSNWYIPNSYWDGTDKPVYEQINIHQVSLLDSIHISNGVVYQTRNRKYEIMMECPLLGAGGDRCSELLELDNGGVDPELFPESVESEITRTCEYIQWDTVLFSFNARNFATYAHSIPNISHISPNLYSGELAIIQVQQRILRQNIADTVLHEAEKFSSYSHPKYRRNFYTQDTIGTLSWTECVPPYYESIPDTFSCIYADFSTGYKESFYSWGFSWRTGLGIVHSALWPVYSISHITDESHKRLVAYHTKSESRGSFSSPNLFCETLNLTKEAFSLSPNPANESFSIRSNGGSRMLIISIFDLHGKELRREAMTLDERWDFSLASFDSGIYLVLIQDMEANVTTQHRLMVIR